MWCQVTKTILLNLDAIFVHNSQVSLSITFASSLFYCLVEKRHVHSETDFSKRHNTCTSFHTDGHSNVDMFALAEGMDLGYGPEGG